MGTANPQTQAKANLGTTPDTDASSMNLQSLTDNFRSSMPARHFQFGSVAGVWKRKWISHLMPAFMTAGLLWACFFPLAQGWLAWIALVPILSLVRSPARPPYVYWSAFAGGLGFFWPVLQWLRVGDYNMMYYSWGAL